MQEINSEATLRDAILLLDCRQSNEEKELREQFRLACDNLRPANLIKTTIKEALGSQALGSNFASTSAGLAAGYISKLLFVNSSHNPLKKLLGFAIQFGTTKWVANHPEIVKSVGSGLQNIIRRARNGRNHEEQNASQK